MDLLNTLFSTKDVKKLPKNNLLELARQIREKIINVTSINGGHIGPNLGVVELTVALHYVFDFTKDLITFDVAHQGYTHKLLTGRQGKNFDNLRKTDGLSGFLSREESLYDHYGAGHAGTALSAALGMATARDLRNSKEHVIALIGDAALTCGITMEALNNVASTTNRLIVILNDNEWSIAKNVGAVAKYLNELITNPLYNRLHKDLEVFLEKIPGGESIRQLGSKAKRETKDFFVPSSLFEKYGLRYIGPIDGHSFEELFHYLEFCKKEINQPILLHVLTKKGKGYEVALKNPEKFHGTGPFEISTGASKVDVKKNPVAPKYESVFGDALLELASKDPKILGITAAMPSGTGLVKLQLALPKQFFDVGIAEEHAVIFAAGLATQGFKPVCAIYSTFLQRAFDPIIHDICLQNLNVTFCMDRAGLSPNDGPTHHGLFDIAYLKSIPRVILMQPKDEDELVDMLHTSLNYEGPTFIRYPRGPGLGVPIKKEAHLLKIGAAECLQQGGDISLWALGPMAQEALLISEFLKSTYQINCSVINARFVKPFDEALLEKEAKGCKLIVTLEDHVVQGGFGATVCEILQDKGLPVPIKRFGWPDKFIEHGSSVEALRNAHQLDTASMADAILETYQKLQTLSPVAYPSHSNI